MYKFALKVCNRELLHLSFTDTLVENLFSYQELLKNYEILAFMATIFDDVIRKNADISKKHFHIF